MMMGSVYPRTPEDTEVPWLRKTVEQLKMAGHTVLVLAPSWQGLRSHSIDDVIVHRFRYAPAMQEVLTHDEGAPNKIRSKPWLQLWAIPYIILGAWRLFKLTLKTKPDVLHIHWPFPHGLMALPTMVILRKKAVFNFHGAELLLATRKPWVGWVLKWCTGFSCINVCNSTFTADKVQKLTGYKAQIIPYGTTLADSVQEDAYKNPYQLLFVGRHIERKGIVYLLQAFAILQKKYPQAVLKITGHGDQTQSLKHWVKQQELQGVHFLGKVSPTELTELYQKSGVFVLPAIVDSRGDTEGLGVVLVEAVSFMLPVVASDVGGISDVIIHQQTGLLVPEKDVEAIVTAVENVWEHPAHAHKRCLQAKEHMHKYFSWPVVMQKLCETYGQCIKA
jgi:glycosyltransferase involved in cell wall biosynthesis